MGDVLAEMADVSRKDTQAGPLNAAQVRRVDEALRKVGKYGEVRLVVVKGRLRFIQVLCSETADVSRLYERQAEG